MLAYTLRSVEALFRKLEREAYRAYHHPVPLHKADHFFNFCVTAQSMRNYLCERLGMISVRDKQPFEDEWSREPLLIAVSEIANLSKHFVLRRSDGTPRTVHTRRLARSSSTFVDVYVKAGGGFAFSRRAGADIRVQLSDGTQLHLYQFTQAVGDYWRRYLHRHGIRVRRQPFARLRGA